MTKRTEMLFKPVLYGIALVLSIGVIWLLSYILAYWSDPESFWAVLYLQFHSNLPLFIALGLFALAAQFLVPTHDRDIAPSDAFVAGLATTSVFVFVSVKWLEPILERSIPLSLPFIQGKWSIALSAISAGLMAIAVMRFSNARTARFAAVWPIRIDKGTVATFVFIWISLLLILAPVIRAIYWSRVEIYLERASGKVYITKELFIASVIFFLVGAAFLYLSRDQLMRSIGRITEGNRNGYRLLAWSQIVGTSETVAGKDGRRRFRIYGGLIVVSALAGVANGSAEDAAFYATVAAWLGALGLRGAGKFAMHGQTLGYAPHVKTEEERREELTPVTRREDCEAFVEEVDGVLWFCVARGTASEGPLPVVERVPFDSFGNFEEGSHKQWFRPRGTVSEMLDWGVIVAQSSVSGIVLVAQSVDEQAWLIELLVKLQTTFIAPRDAMLRALKEAQHKRRADDEPTGSSGAPIDATPVKPF
jgi:hypothetical protein